MEVILALGPRLNRCLPEASYVVPMAVAKVSLGILSVDKKSDNAALERGVKLFGEGFPIMLCKHHSGDLLLPCMIGCEGITKQVYALERLGQKSEAAAWMREYVPRFEAAVCSVLWTRMTGIIAQLYNVWARSYLSLDFTESKADELLGRGSEEAERVARKAVALTKGAGRRADLVGYEFDLACILSQRSVCAAALENL